MKYYVFEVATGDSKIAGKGVYEYNTLNEAVANFHSKLGIAMKSDLYDSDLVMVINAEGGVHKVEKYTKPVVIEEPEVEEITE